MKEREEFQLLNESDQAKIGRIKGANRPIILGVLVVLLISGAYAGLYFVEKSLLKEIKTIEDQMNDIKTSRDLKLEDKLIAFDKKLKSVDSVLKEHLIWSSALNIFNNHIQPKVKVDKFDVKREDISYMFSAKTDTFTSVAQQISSFYGDDRVKNVILGQLSKDTENGVTFDLEIEFDPSIISTNKNASNKSTN